MTIMTPTRWRSALFLWSIAASLAATASAGQYQLIRRGQQLQTRETHEFEEPNTISLSSVRSRERRRRVANEDGDSSEEETPSPTDKSTPPPTDSPTESPSSRPTPSPTTPAPTDSPTERPTESPTDSPTVSPTKSPSSSPTTAAPTVSAQPSSVPSGQPTRVKSSLELHISANCAMYGGIEFYDEESYWMKALRFVEFSYNATIHDNWRVCQRYALSCIYYATSGVATAYTDSLFGIPGFSFRWLRKWANDTDYEEQGDECGWWGVHCNSNGNVTELNLAANWLMGTFPGEVIVLAETLEVLDLEYNLCSNPGRLHTEWLGELTKLKSLNLGKTGFGYENQGIPPYIANLTELIELNLYSTLFFGPLDENIFTNLINLEYLDIGALSFDGPLPTTLQNLPNLTYLYLDYSDFTGGLDEFFNDTSSSAWPSLVEIWMDNNPELGGGIPNQIANVTTLQSLSMTNCGLEGPIPTVMGDLVNMKQMWLYDNELNGTIPEQFSQMAALQRLQLQDNDLTGGVSSGICQLTYANLKVLGVDCEVSCSCCTCGCGTSC